MGTRAASTYNTEKTTFLLNWYANPYHTPIYVAKEQGWLKEEGIDPAILEATDPSDVTEIVGDGAIGLGLKAMIHILAAKDKGIDMKSFGTILDEPPTGLIHKKSANINKFSDIQGKKVGYIGHFGKVMIDDLAKQAGIPLDSFETVRVGMNATAAILRGDIDTGVGFTNFQRIELEELSAEDAGLLLLLRRPVRGQRRLLREEPGEDLGLHARHAPRHRLHHRAPRRGVEDHDACQPASRQQPVRQDLPAHSALLLARPAER